MEIYVDIYLRYIYKFSSNNFKIKDFNTYKLYWNAVFYNVIF